MKVAQPQETKDLLTIQEAARETSVGETAIRNAIYRGKLRKMEMYGRILIERTALDEYRSSIKTGRPAGSRNKKDEGEKTIAVTEEEARRLYPDAKEVEKNNRMNTTSENIPLYPIGTELKHASRGKCVYTEACHTMQSMNAADTSIFVQFEDEGVCEVSKHFVTRASENNITPPEPSAAALQTYDVFVEYDMLGGIYINSILATSIEEATQRARSLPQYRCYIHTSEEDITVSEQTPKMKQILANRHRNAPTGSLPTAEKPTTMYTFITVPEAADILGITDQAVRDAVQRGEIKGTNLGGRYIVTWLSVEAYKEHTRVSGEKPKESANRKKAGGGETNGC